MFWGVLEGSCMDHEGSWGILGASWTGFGGFVRNLAWILGALADLGGVLEGS